MFKLGTQCQSCAMPLSKDPEHGGTNADGSKSTEYCSYCFVNGQFVDGGVSLDEYRQKLDQILKDQKMSWFLRTMTWYQLPTLKRWKKS
jgi:hypothetical protein